MIVISIIIIVILSAVIITIIVTPTAALLGPIGSSTESPSGAVRMRLPHPVQRFVAPWGTPPKGPVAQFACVSPIQHRASWPHREPHR
eukprot:7101363-Pyramimonas_sp.AAC.1